MKAEFTPEVQDIFTIARVKLYHDHPFIAQLAQYMVPIPSSIVPAAGVTAKKKMYMNPEIANKCKVTDMMWFLTHETMHLVTATHNRMPEGANQMLWNIASDISINYLINSQEGGMGLPLPRPELFVPLFGEEFKKYDNWTDVEIYYDLLKNHKCPFCGKGMSDDSQQGSGDSDEEKVSQNTSGSGNSCGCFKGYWWDGSGSALGDPLSEDSMTEKERSEWRERIASAAESARQQGKLPGALDKFCTDILKARKNWRRILSMETTKALRKKYDWKKISRRTAGRIRTPGKSPYLPEAVGYIDTSGSMSDDDISQAINEMAAIFRLGGGKGILILGDAEVYYCGEMTVSGLRNIPVQRGGTDFRPVFDKIEEQGIKPAIFVGFSDLCGSFPEIAPKYTVIWCRPEGYKAEAPFGKILDIELNN